MIASSVEFQPPRGCSDPALEAEGAHAASGTDRTDIEVRCRLRDRRAGIVFRHGQSLDIAQISVVALEHERIYGRGLAADIQVAFDGMAHQCGAAGADRQGVGEENGRLDGAEFLDLHQAGTLAEAVQNMNGRDGLLAIEIAAAGARPSRPVRISPSTSVRWPTRTPGTSAILLSSPADKSAAGEADVPGAGRAHQSGIPLSRRPRFRMRGDPDIRAAGDLLQQLFENPNSRAIACDMRMHGEQEEPAFFVSPLEFAEEDVEDRRRRGVWTQPVEAVHVEIHASSRIHSTGSSTMPVGSPCSTSS